MTALTNSTIAVPMMDSNFNLVLLLVRVDFRAFFRLKHDLYIILLFHSIVNHRSIYPHIPHDWLGCHEHAIMQYVQFLSYLHGQQN